MFQDLMSYEDYIAEEATATPTPAHWERRSLGSLLTQLSERDHPDLPLLSVARERGVFVRSAGDANHNVIPDDLTNYKVARRGNLVINKMKAWQGSMGIAPVDGIVSPAYFVYDLRIENLEYAHLLLRSKPYAAKYAAASDGVRVGQWDLVDARFRRIPVALPPAEEQRAIVIYLAHAHQRINKAIATKRRLVSLLDEAMQVEVRRMVLRGLDDSVDIRDSGINWLGDVPAHWGLSALRFHYSQELGKMLDAKRITGAHLVPYLRNTDVQWGAINTADLPEMDITEAEYLRYTVRDGDLLVCEGGEVGRAAIWRGEVTVGFQKALHRLRPLDDQRDVPEYLFWLLRCAVWADAFNDGRVSTIAHLTGDKLRAHRFPWPSYDEQLGIVAAVTHVVEAADAHRDVVQREIALLEEFRTRLTVDVVTGQVDVRSIAASLPSIDLAEVFNVAAAGSVEGDETATGADVEDE